LRSTSFGDLEALVFFSLDLDLDGTFVGVVFAFGDTPFFLGLLGILNSDSFLLATKPSLICFLLPELTLSLGELIKPNLIGVPSSSLSDCSSLSLYSLS
tara:strand:+ start:449 stop:745 length:297 start_codon:yes stop_codon:yes gene_type:complete